MKEVRGYRQPLPLMAEAGARARELGRNVAGDDLFLLALTQLPADSPSRRVLNAEGIDEDRVLDLVRTRADGEKTSADGHVRYPPAFYSMSGRAEAFAAALGDGTITPEHVLLALVWDPMSATSQLMWRVGASRTRIIDRLGDLGLRVPRTEPPPQREVDIGARVWVERDQVSRVLQYLGLHIPPGTAWGFNYEGDRAWINAETRVALPDLVDRALQEQDAAG